jgi:hypothetical protein
VPRKHSLRRAPQNPAVLFDLTLRSRSKTAMASIFGDFCALMAGLAIGYVVASLLESHMHQRVGHAPNGSVKRWQRHPRLFRSRLDTRHSHHVVHHRRSFKQDHVTQFRSHQERAMVDLELACLGAQGERIKRSGYGLRLQGDGALSYVLPPLLVMPSISSPWGAWMAAGIFVAMALPPLLSHFIHPYLHMPHEHALMQAPAPTAWLLEGGISRRWRAATTCTIAT